MGDMMDDNDPFEEDIVFDQAGLLGGKSSRSRLHHNSTGFFPTFMLFSRTLFLCVAFIGLGLCGSISRGPVIKMQEWLGVEEWEALHTFTAHSVGALIGGVLGSKLFDVYNRQFLVFVSLVWVSVSVSLLPFTIPISLWWMRVTLVAISAGIAFLFTGGNVLCLDLWGRQGGGASLQALHFSYALGAFIAPVIIHPFFAGQHMPPSNSNFSRFGNISATVGGSLLFEPHALSTLQPLLISTINSDVADALASDGPLADKNLVRVPRIDGKDNNKLLADGDSLSLHERSVEQNNKKYGGSVDMSAMSQDYIMKLTLPHNVTSSNITQLNATQEPASKNEKITENPIINNLTANVTNNLLQSNDDNNTNADNSHAEVTLVESATNSTKPAKHKPSHTGASVTNDDGSIWKRPPVNNAIPQKTAESSENDGEINNTIGAIAANQSVPVSTSTENVNNASLSTELTAMNASVLGNDGSNVGKPALPKPTHADGKFILDSEIISTTNEAPVPVLVSSPSDANVLAQPATSLATAVSSTKSVPFISSTPVPVLLTTASATIFNNSVPSTVSAASIDKLSVGSSNIGTPAISASDHVSGHLKHQLSLFTSSAQSESDTSSSYGMKLTDYSAPETLYDNGQMSVPIPEPEVLDLKEPLANKGAEQSYDGSIIEKNENNTEDAPAENKIIHSIVHFLKKPGTFSNITDDTNNKFIETIAQKFKRYGVTKIHLAFICVGIFVLINSMIFVVILCHNPREPRSKQEEGILNHAPHSRYMFFMVMFSLFMFTAEALEGAIHHLLASNAEQNGLSILDKGVDGPALFWGLVCLVRFLCILLSGCIRLKPGKLLGVCIFFTTVGTVFLCIGSFGKEDFLWSGIILASLGLAPTLPTSLLWMAQYMHVTHKMCAIMIIVTSFGNSLTHGGLTHIAANSHLYAYILVSMSLSSLVLLIISWCVIYNSKVSGGGVAGSGANNSSRRGGGAGALSGDPSSDGYHLARQNEDDDGMEMSRHLLRRSSHHSLDQNYSTALGGGGSSGGGERNQHRQLRHMHDLEHEEAGQSLLID